MTFDEAKVLKIRSGSFAGKTLDDISQTDSGLIYLDRLVGWDKLKGTKLHEALKVFVSRPRIKSAIANALNSGGCEGAWGPEEDYYLEDQEETLEETYEHRKSRERPG